MNWIVKLVDADKLGGWVRAGVAALIPVIVVKLPVLGSILTPDVALALGVTISGVVVGVWSQIAKSLSGS